MTAATLTIGILAVAGALVLGYLYWESTRRKRPVENVPPGMRPAYSDEQLEKTVLERYMAWGVILTLFFAIFFPVYWVIETGRLADATEERYVTQVVTGEELYQENCAECHAGDLSGGAASSPYPGDDAWPAPALNNIVARYEDNPHVDDMEDFLWNTIYWGRPGSPMPPYGGDAAGPFTDEEIENVKQFILANQVDEVAEPDDAEEVSGAELYSENCMRCHGPELQGWDDEEEPRAGPPLIGVFDRHRSPGILGILQTGISRPGQVRMPPWQEGYQHQPYTDEALVRIINHLREEQPEDLLPEEEAEELDLADIEAMVEDDDEDDDEADGEADGEGDDEAGGEDDDEGDA